MRSALALSIMLAACGCAHAPTPEPVVSENPHAGTVPLIKPDGSIAYTDDPNPDGGRMLFCVTYPDITFCVIDHNGHVLTIYAPADPIGWGLPPVPGPVGPGT